MPYNGNFEEDKLQAQTPITETTPADEAQLIRDLDAKVKAWEKRQKRIENAETRAGKMLQVRRNERRQRSLAASEVLKVRAILLGKDVDWGEKVAALTKLSPWAANVMDLSEQVVIQNRKVLEDLGINQVDDSGMIPETMFDSDNLLARKFRTEEGGKHTKNSVEPDEMDLASKPKAELEAEQ